MAETIYPDEGLAGLLDWMTGQGSGEIVLPDCEVGLYTAPTSPDLDTVFADLTEPTFTGYARLPFSGLSLGPAAVAARVASAPGTLTTFTFGGGTAATVYGWFLVDAGGTTLVAITKFDYGPYTVNVVGQTIRFTATLQLASLFTTTP